MAKQAIAQDFLPLWQTETCPALRTFFATEYRRLVGVDPIHHDEFKEALESIRDGGGMRVDEVAAIINRRDQLNGSSLPLGDTMAGA